MSDFVPGSDAEETDAGPVTIFDVQPDEKSKIRVRALPRLTTREFRIAWAAGRREFIVSTLLQLISGGGIALLLLLGERGLRRSSLHSKTASRSRQSHRGPLQSPQSPESSHLSPQCNANGKRSSGN